MREVLFAGGGALLAGILSGMGIGGGSILLIFLSVFLSIGQQTAQLYNLLYFIPTALFALWQHKKNGLLDLYIIFYTAAFGVAAAIAASFLANFMEGDLLKRLFGIFLFLIGIKELFFTGKSEKKRGNS